MLIHNRGVERSAFATRMTFRERGQPLERPDKDIRDAEPLRVRAGVNGGELGAVAVSSKLAAWLSAKSPATRMKEREACFGDS